MKVLLDENLPHKLRSALDGDVSTVAYMGWAGIKNGQLLQVAEAEGFDVLLTADQNLSYQQNLASRRVALIVVSSQRWEALEAHLEAIKQAVLQSRTGTFSFIQCEGSIDL